MLDERTDPRPHQVAEGIWNLPVPFPNPLQYTHCYLLDDDDGIVLVDAGWDSEESWTGFCAGMSAAGAQLSDLVGVVITHIHPDHYGLAARLRDHTSAWIGMHSLEADRIPTTENQVHAVLEEMVDWLYAVGAPEDEIQALRDDGPAIADRTSMLRPDVLLADGQHVPGSASLTAIHTPGHTPGHLCFLDEARKVLFTGDHLLPRITPNVSQRPQSGVDPLGHFRRSVAKTRGLGAVLGLPGHEWAIADLDARIDVLSTHHDERLHEIEQAVRDGARTVWEVAKAVHWSRPWETLKGLQRRSAIGETHSHLERLARERRVRCEGGRPDRWTPLSDDVARRTPCGPGR